MPADAEQTPGQRFAHLGRIVVHRLEVDPGHSGQPVAVLSRIENYPPGWLRRTQCAVSAVFKREGRRTEQDAFTAGVRNVPTAGRIGIPYVEPGAMRGLHRLRDNTPSRAEPGDLEHVHVRAEEFRLAQRRPPVEHLKERAPADRRVHASPLPALTPASPVSSTSPGQRAGAPAFPHRADGKGGDTRGLVSLDKPGQRGRVDERAQVGGTRQDGQAGLRQAAGEGGHGRWGRYRVEFGRDCR